MLVQILVRCTSLEEISLLDEALQMGTVRQLAKAYARALSDQLEILAKQPVGALAREAGAEILNLESLTRRFAVTANLRVTSTF